MTTHSRAPALASYLIPLGGPAAALALRRDEPFTRYHAMQGLAIDLGMLGAPLLWGAVGWVLAWLPSAGPLLAVVLFGMVLALELLLLVGRVLGVYWVLHGELRTAPVVGGWAERVALAEEPAVAVSEIAAEPAPAAEISSPK